VLRLIDKPKKERKKEKKLKKKEKYSKAKNPHTNLEIEI